MTVGQKYYISYHYSVNLGGPQPNSGFCDLGAGIDAGGAGPKIPAGQSATGTATTTFVATNGAPQNFTINMSCDNNDYSTINVSKFVLMAI